jgi:hypothetical protein
MARLRHATSRTAHYLEHESLLGRAQAATVCNDLPSVSLHHATVRWTGSGEWQVEDLNSRNGTFVDGERLTPGVARTLKTGASIALGTLDNRYELEEASAPTVMLLPLAGGEPLWPLAEPILPLPNADAPTHTLYAHPSGLWLLEGPNDTRPLQHGDIVVVNESSWRFSCPKTVNRTMTVPAGRLAVGASAPTGFGAVGELQLLLKVSADEETVLVSLTGAGQTRELDYRACFYLLLTLARGRLGQGLPKTIRVDSQGWVEVGALCEMLRKSEQHLNIDIYRLRRICAELGLLDPSNIVERRGPPRRLRLGSEFVRIEAL